MLLLFGRHVPAASGVRQKAGTRFAKTKGQLTGFQLSQYHIEASGSLSNAFVRQFFLAGCDFPGRGGELRAKGILAVRD